MRRVLLTRYLCYNKRMQNPIIAVQKNEARTTIYNSHDTALAPRVDQPADRHPALVYLSSLAPGSRRTMRQALDVVAGLLTQGQCDHVTLPWGALRFQHVQAVRAALAERYRAATANKMLAALRQTLKTAWRLGELSAEEYQRAVDVPPVRGSGPTAATGRALSHGEWSALFIECALDLSPAGVRDGAMLAVLRVTGLRRAEVAALRVDDYDPEERRLVVRGKGNKTRVVPIEDAGARDALADWLFLRGRVGTLIPDAPLFTRIPKGGQLTEDALTDQGVYWILRKRGEQAGVRPFTPHDLRRSFAGDLLDAGVDLPTVQALMGHAGVDTTAKYDRRGERVQRAAVQKLHVPYQRRYG